MNWVVRTVTSSIGKKFLMAVTGLGLCSFLLVHLIGNLFLYAGRDSFNEYAAHLHALGFLITLAEAGLILLFSIHAVFGLWLFWGNLMARPTRYQVDKWAGGRTWSSRLIPYTGMFNLVFILVHLFTLILVDLESSTIYDVVDHLFSSFRYVLFYTLAMASVAFHVMHGVWSAFQTLGLNHPKYMPIIKFGGVAFAGCVAVGFGLIPLFILVG